MMNERIKELAHGVGLPTYNQYDNPTKLEKFAELIVRECVTIIEDLVARRVPASLYADELRKLASKK